MLKFDAPSVNLRQITGATRVEIKEISTCVSRKVTRVSAWYATYLTHSFAYTLPRENTPRADDSRWRMSSISETTKGKERRASGRVRVTFLGSWRAGWCYELICIAGWINKMREEKVVACTRVRRFQLTYIDVPVWICEFYGSARIRWRTKGRTISSRICMQLRCHLLLRYYILFLWHARRLRTPLTFSSTYSSKPANIYFKTHRRMLDVY